MKMARFREKNKLHLNFEEIILSQTYKATRLRHFFSHFNAMQDGLPDICWSAIANK